MTGVKYREKFMKIQLKQGHFKDVALTKIGASLMIFLTKNENIIRMETATELRRPAVEGLSRVLLENFEREIKKDRLKQFIGYIVRQIMEDIGYRVDVQNVAIRTGNLFSKATRYVKNN